jgi:hypothetical protein
VLHILQRSRGITTCFMLLPFRCAAAACHIAALTLTLSRRNRCNTATGWAVSEGGRRRGFAEELRLQFELGVTAVFDTVRWLVRRTLRVPQERGSPALQGALPGGPDEGAGCYYLAAHAALLGM